ncbi:MAG: hypothetical protein J1E16_11825 [Muribaculaceae bacterium]|nr:hypothetical protein [Muribaculaceae bacterium]
MKKVIYFHILLISILLGLNSCTSVDEPQLTLPVTEEQENDGFQILDFEISVNDINETRCIRPETSHSDDSGTYTYNFPSEKCSPSITNVKYMEMMILYDKEILNSTIIVDKSVIQDFTDNEYVVYVNKRTNGEQRFYLALKFKSNLDPSKIELLFTVKFPSASNWIIETTGGSCFFKNNDDLNNCYISTSNTAELCSYYAKHSLNTENDWKTVNLKIILKRLNSSIWVFTTHPYCDAFDDYISWFSIGLNNERTFNNFLDDEGNLIFHQKIVNGAVSSTQHRYYVLQDRTELSQYSLYQYSGTSKGKTWWWYNDEGYNRPHAASTKLFKYNDKTYYYIGYFNTLGTLSDNYPISHTGKVLKYLTMVYNESWCNQNNYHYDGYLHYHWSTLPLPDGGLKANTRYVYILNDDFKLWENTWYQGDLPTRSSTEETLQATGFTLIEQSMDEPLPFEFMEEE